MESAGQINLEVGNESVDVSLDDEREVTLSGKATDQIVSVEGSWLVFRIGPGASQR